MPARAEVVASHRLVKMVDLVASGDHTGQNQKNMILVYVIQSISKKYRYIGITNNLEKRISQHTLKKSFYAPFKVILTEKYLSYTDARKREIYLKSGQGRLYLDSLS